MNKYRLTSWIAFPIGITKSYPIIGPNISWAVHRTLPWHHDYKMLSALFALCEGNPLVSGGFLSQRPVMQKFDVLYDVSHGKLLNKRSSYPWFETPWCPLHCNISKRYFTTQWTLSNYHPQIVHMVAAFLFFLFFAFFDFCTCLFYSCHSGSFQWQWSYLEEYEKISMFNYEITISLHHYLKTIMILTDDWMFCIWFIMNGWDWVSTN